MIQKKFIFGLVMSYLWSSKILGAEHPANFALPDNIARTIGHGIGQVISETIRSVSEAPPTMVQDDNGNQVTATERFFTSIGSGMGKGITQAVNTIMTEPPTTITNAAGEEVPAMQGIFENMGNALRESNLFRNVVEDGVDGFLETMNNAIEEHGVFSNFGRDAGQALDHVGEGAASMIRRMGTQSTIWGLKIAAVSLGFIVVYYGLKYAYHYALMMMTTPKLEIEQSEGAIKSFFKYTILQQERKIETIDQLILEPETKKKVTQYRDMLFFAQANKAPMTNLLLYGPPGTGKTEIGKRIAKERNSTFVYFSGASLAAFKESEAIKKMKEMFEWAKKKGNIIIFIDEIETLLPSRLDGSSEQRRNLLTEFLAYTGKRSDKFAIIGATNIPSAMDGAVARRFDKAIEIGLPGPIERLMISEMYKNKQLQEYPSLIMSPLLNDISVRRNIMNTTKGLSGGEIESVWTNSSLYALASNSRHITPELIEAEIKNVLEKKNTIGKAFAVAAA